MRKTYQYRIYPTKRQARLLESQLEDCRWLYNKLLEQRKTRWEEHQQGISLYDQQATFGILKDLRPTLANVHSQVLQNVAVRIDLAFKAFFRRARAGEKPGYPRFKGYGRYDSLTFPQVQTGGCAIKDGRLKVSKVGQIKIIQHRPLKGTPKTATLTRTSTGKWFVCFSCEVEPKRLPQNEAAVGIDVGLSVFAALSDGQVIENPRFFRKEEKELAKVQRKLSKETKGTPARKFRRKAVARVHERIGNKRDNFSHQHSRTIVNQFGTIAVEDLHVNRMVHNHCLAKSIADAAWSAFFNMLGSKAAEAGYLLIKVNPAYTSQDCSGCGHRQKMPLSQRVYNCPCCNQVKDRDLNASINIKRIGLDSLRVRPIEAPSFSYGE